MIMKKLQYIQPKSDVTSVVTSHLMDELLGSNTAPQPAPKRGIAPEVPGESL